MSEIKQTLQNDIYKCFIRILMTQKEEEICIFDDKSLYKEIKIATLEKIDRTINNKDFIFKHKPKEKYIVFISVKQNPNFGEKRSYRKIKEKNISIDFNLNNKNLKNSPKNSAENINFFKNNIKKKISFDIGLQKDNKLNNFLNTLNLNLEIKDLYLRKISSENISKENLLIIDESDKVIKNTEINEKTEDNSNKNEDFIKYITTPSNELNQDEINTEFEVCMNKEIEGEKKDKIILKKAKKNFNHNDSIIMNISNRDDLDNEIQEKNENEEWDGFDINLDKRKQDKNIVFNNINENTNFINNLNINEEKFNNHKKKFSSKNNLMQTSYNVSSNINITEMINNFKNSEKKDTKVFLTPDEILNFEYEKYNFFLSFIKITSNKNLIDIIKSLSQKEILSLSENLRKTNNLDDLKDIEESDFNKIKEIMSNISIKLRVVLNREYTFLNHTNKDSFRYFFSKTIKFFDFDIVDFEKKIVNFPVLDIETRKYDKEQKVIDDGVLHVIFILCDDLQTLVELFSKIKYEVYFSKYALTNYICKYIHELVYEFTHISENFLEYIKNFGFANENNETIEKNENDTEEVKELRKISTIRDKCLQDNLKRNSDKDSNFIFSYPNNFNEGFQLEKELIIERNQSDQENEKFTTYESESGNIFKRNEMSFGKNDSKTFKFYKECKNETNQTINKEYNKEKENEKNRLIPDEKKIKVENKSKESIEFLPKNTTKRKNDYKVLEINYPFKKIGKDLNDLIDQNLIKYLLKNIASLKQNYDLNSIQFPKFLKLFMKYNTQLMNEEGLRMKHSYLRKNEHSAFRYFKDFLIIEKQDKISKDHKINLNKIILYFIETIQNEYFGKKRIMNENTITSNSPDNAVIPNKNDSKNLSELNINSNNFINFEIDDGNKRKKSGFIQNNKEKEFDADFKSEKNSYTKKKENLDKFILKSLNTYIGKYIYSTGFINIDIIFNDEFMIQDNFNSLCFKKNGCLHSCKSKIIGCLFSSFSKVVDFLNKFLKMNEGFYHKHLSIMNYSYNFNEKNVIFTFKTNYDTSKKSKIRMFDVYFLETWITHISSLILFIYKKSFFFNPGSTNVYKNFFENEEDNKIFNENNNRMGCIEKNQLLKNYKEFICCEFFRKFSKVASFIAVDFLKIYKNNLPDFKTFCKKISKFPIKSYNTIDNLCQHFANYSLEILLAKLITTDKLLFDIIKIKKKKEKLLCEKNEKSKENKEKFSMLEFDFKNLYEPFLFNIDEKMMNFIKNKKNIDHYLKKNKIDENFFIESMKKILKNYENFNKNIIYVNEKYRKIDKIQEKSPIIKNESPLLKNESPLLENESPLYNFTKTYNLNTTLKISNFLNNFNNEVISYQKSSLEHINELCDNNTKFAQMQNNNKDVTFVNISNIKTSCHDKYELIDENNEFFKKKFQNLKKFDFYFNDNLFNIFSFKKTQLLFDKIKDFYFIKKYNNFIRHNLNISFDKKERSIHTDIPDNSRPRKEFIKRKKQEILEALNFIKKIREKHRRLNYTFFKIMREKFDEYEEYLMNNEKGFKYNFNTLKECEFENQINDSIYSEIKNMTMDIKNKGEENYLNFRLGHVLFLLQNEKYRNSTDVDNLIENLIIDD